MNLNENHPAAKNVAVWRGSDVRLTIQAVAEHNETEESDKEVEELKSKFSDVTAKNIVECIQHIQKTVTNYQTQVTTTLTEAQKAQKTTIAEQIKANNMGKVTLTREQGNRESLHDALANLTKVHHNEL